METLSREMMIGMLRTGKDGNQILEILDAITETEEGTETQEVEVAAA